MRLIAALIALVSTTGFAQAPDADAASRHVELLAKYYEHGQRREHDRQAELWARDAINNGRQMRPDAIRAILEDIYRTFPDYQSTVLEMRASGDTVVALSRISGTHRGVAQTDFNGGLLKGARPTGRKFEVLVTHWWRFRDGKIAWHQATRDELGMYLQLGLLPDRLPDDKLAPSTLK
jgi:predicted ester cyclase